MPLQIIRDDITKVRCDAIVNAAKNSLLGGGGVDGAIHKAAGPGLLEECRGLGGCETGQAKITGGYALPCRYVIHTVGPIWQGGGHGERALLESCYRSSLALARDYGCHTVAFPLISAGVFGYPKDQALRVAVDAVSAFLMENDDMDVYLVVFSQTPYLLSQKLFSDVRSFIDDHYVDTHYDSCAERARRMQLIRRDIEPHDVGAAPAQAAPPAPAAGKKGTSLSHKAAASAPMPMGHIGAYPTLERRLAQMDESFSQMLLRKIDERGMTDAACYKKANIDRKLFSKIRSDAYYKPSKQTAIAFAIALELDLDETRELLMKAGYALSPASKSDVIVEYFIRRGNYNIFEINEALFVFDQSLLGA